jgi:uncharacterized protein YecT (DUF1311 family)
MERGHLCPQSLRKQAQLRSRFALMRARMPALHQTPLALSARLSNTCARSREDESMKFFVSLLIVAIALSISVSGQKTKPCATTQTQAEMNICWGNEYKKADAKLNQTYQQLAAMLDDEQKTQLKNAENAWIKYKDADCEFAADQYKGGSIRPMIAAICLADVTNNRTTELKNQIKDRNQ